LHASSTHRVIGNDRPGYNPADFVYDLVDRPPGRTQVVGCIFRVAPGASEIRHVVPEDTGDLQLRNATRTQLRRHRVSDGVRCKVFIEAGRPSGDTPHGVDLAHRLIVIGDEVSGGRLHPRPKRRRMRRSTSGPCADAFFLPALTSRREILSNVRTIHSPIHLGRNPAALPTHVAGIERTAELQRLPTDTVNVVTSIEDTRGTRTVEIYMLSGRTWMKVLSEEYFTGDIFVSYKPGQNSQVLNALVGNLYVGNKDCPTREAPNASSQSREARTCVVRWQGNKFTYKPL